MKTALLKHFFAHDYSLTQAAFGAGVTVLLYEGRYLGATLMFFAGVALCVVGELALERRHA